MVGMSDIHCSVLSRLMTLMWLSMGGKRHDTHLRFVNGDVVAVEIGAGVEVGGVSIELDFEVEESGRWPILSFEKRERCSKKC